MVSLSAIRFGRKINRQRLCNILHLSSEVFVFEVRRENQPSERIAEKELIFAVIESEAHFV